MADGSAKEVTNKVIEDDGKDGVLFVFSAWAMIRKVILLISGTN